MGGAVRAGKEMEKQKLIKNLTTIMNSDKRKAR